jgi:8-oxo-dGTP pyrophosphatase MutT (NUDIX family)
LGWPIWYVYFRANRHRSRVIVLVDDHFLAVKTWLSGDTWGLPGGGAHKNETLPSSAVRELYEEVGIISHKTNLTPLLVQHHHKHGMHYDGHYFLLCLKKRPKMVLRQTEIASAVWLPIDMTQTSLKLDDGIMAAIAATKQKLRAANDIL